mmetsp:Transcript_29535/g.52889  ORF Transcript_29535/g.52889 Transcript_29535/m.52889 type:complete len:207 (-) Transcript_29535:2154-2774(-)
MGPEFSMQTPHSFVCVQRVFLDEPLHVVKLEGFQEMQQSPKFLDAVLQRRPCHEQLIFKMPCHQLLIQCTLVILQPVRLIHQHEVPFDFVEDSCILQHHLKRGDHHLKTLLPTRPAIGLKLVAARYTAADGVTDVHHCVNLRRPFGKLFNPVVYSGERHNDKKGAQDGQRVGKIGAKGDTLDRFAKPHLVCQDDIIVLQPRVDEPV